MCYHHIDGSDRGNQVKNGTPGQNLPKNFITPWILLGLKQWNVHGYMLLQRLSEMGLPNIDHATLYKELRGLERDGYITSIWETNASGPAKRVYRLTQTGEELLLGWADVVAGYQRMANAFFDTYAQVFGVAGKQVKTEEKEAHRGK